MRHLRKTRTEGAFRYPVIIGIGLCAAILTGCGGGGDNSTPSKPAYILVDLGVASANQQSYAADINEDGHVVVSTSLINTATFEPAFLYKDGQLSSLAQPLSFFARINNQDQILDPGTGLYYSGGSFTNVNSLYSLNGKFFIPSSLNDHGDFIGNLTGVPVHAGLVVNGAVQDLGLLTGRTATSGLDVNDNRQAVGFAYNTDTTGTTIQQRAVLFTNGSVVDLGVLPGDITSTGDRINNKGEVIGTSWPADSSGLPPATLHYFLYSQGKMRQIPMRGSDINDNSQIVGQFPATFISGGLTDAALYQSGVTYHLIDCTSNARGWKLTSAASINNKGQIVGSGTFNGKIHGYLLNPQ